MPNVVGGGGTNVGRRYPVLYTRDHQDTLNDPFLRRLSPSAKLFDYYRQKYVLGLQQQYESIQSQRQRTLNFRSWRETNDTKNGLRRCRQRMNPKSIAVEGCPFFGLE